MPNQLKVRFGQLKNELAHCCRFWHRTKGQDGSSASRLLTAQEWLSSVSRTLPRTGTAELMAQSGSGGSRTQASAVHTFRIDPEIYSWSKHPEERLCNIYPENLGDYLNSGALGLHSLAMAQNS